MKWSTATAFWWPLTCFLQVIVVKVMRKLRDAIFYFSAQKVLLILYSAVHFISRWNYVCIKGMYLINVVSKLKTSLEKITEFPGLTRVLLFMFSYISLDSFYFKASCHNLMFHSLHCWNTREFWHQLTWNICLNKCSIGACQLWPVAFSYSSCWMYLEGWHSAGSEVNFGISLIMLQLQNLYLIMYVRGKWLFSRSWDSLLGCGTSITMRTQFALGSWRTLQRLKWSARQTETLLPNTTIKPPNHYLLPELFPFTGSF